MPPPRRRRLPRWDRPSTASGMATRPGATKRARLSTWPSVWSLSRPSPSQTTRSHPRSRCEPLLDLLPVEARVAVGVEQALFGGQERARSVAVDRAAFENPVGLRVGQGRQRREPLADAVVAGQVIFAAPAVEAEALGAAMPCRFPGRSPRCREARCRRRARRWRREGREPRAPRPRQFHLPRPARPPRPRHRHEPPLAKAATSRLGGEQDRPAIGRQRWGSRSRPLRAAPIREEEEEVMARAPSNAARGRAKPGLAFARAIVHTPAENQGELSMCVIIVRCAAVSRQHAVTAVAAGAQTLAEDAAAFGARQAFGAPDLSPDGSSVVYVAPGPGRKAATVISNLATGNSWTVVSADGDPEKLHWCDFVNDWPCRLPLSAASSPIPVCCCGFAAAWSHSMPMAETPSARPGRQQFRCGSPPI